MPRDPLVLMTDPLGGTAMWDGLAPLLTEGFAVLRETDVGPHAAPDTAEPPIDAWWEAEVLRSDQYPVHLVASGFAAPAAVGLARRRPELLRSIVFHAPILRLDGPVGPTDPNWSEIEAGFAPVAAAIARQDGIVARDRWREAIAPSERRPPRGGGPLVPPDGGQRRWAGAWSDRRAVGLAPPLEIDFLPPVLVVDGDQSPPALRTIADRLAACFPNATRLTLPNSGALLPEEDPRRLAAVLFSFCLERNVPTA